MTEKLKNAFHRLFFSFYGCPNPVVLCASKEEYSSSEKRQLEEFPQFSWSSLMDGLSWKQY